MLNKVPASSKADPLLAKAEPMSNIHGMSVIIGLRRGKKKAMQQLLEGNEKV